MGEITGEHKQFGETMLLGGLSSLAVASHELKSPLALIRQLALALESDLVPESEKKRLLRQISLTSEKALRLTGDLTKSVRLPEALFNLEPINPYQLCQDVIKEIDPLFRANERKVTLKSKRKHLLLVANRDLLRRVILNFSDNALNYADDKTDIEINIDTYNRGKTVRLGVRDYGPAVPCDVFAKLEDKLSKVSSSSIYARPQSSGLGLYIVSQFAEAMNGKIGVTRHRDGATFFIDLQSSRQLSLL